MYSINIKTEWSNSQCKNAPGNVESEAERASLLEKRGSIKQKIKNLLKTWQAILQALK